MGLVSYHQIKVNNTINRITLFFFFLVCLFFSQDIQKIFGKYSHKKSVWCSKGEVHSDIDLPKKKKEKNKKKWKEKRMNKKEQKISNKQPNLLSRRMRKMNKQGLSRRKEIIKIREEVNEMEI